MKRDIEKGHEVPVRSTILIVFGIAMVKRTFYNTRVLAFLPYCPHPHRCQDKNKHKKVTSHNRDPKYQPITERRGLL